MEEQKQEHGQGQENKEKMYKCAKCGKEKHEDEGVFMLNGTAFCCENCCKKEDHVEGNICEYC